MRTAYLFPGLNAIARDRDRIRYLHLPQVREYMQRLSGAGLQHVLEQPARVLFQSGDFAGTAALTLAIQAGIFDHLRARETGPAVLMGCSLGDLSRSVCAGAMSFEDALRLIPRFERLASQYAASGSTWTIRLPAGQRFDPRLRSAFRELELEVSVLSDRHLIVGCNATEAEGLESLAQSRGWSITVAPFDYPLHSRHLAHAVHTHAVFFQSLYCDPDVPVFSAIQLSMLTTATALSEDAMRCFYMPVQWVGALSVLKRKFNVERFVNIGPCRSLPALLRETRLNIKMENVAIADTFKGTETVERATLNAA